ncbi:MAG TPA: glycosyltransferase family protein [Chitinophagaceae bacterium]|nr:glycosyltransferase family protein [Chitinophagaceae bacterium]
MKILYAVQATGNGHIARAMELLPSLRLYGQVDIFLSGANSQLNADLPVRYRSKGLSLFYNNGGGLHYGKTIKSFDPLRVWREVKALPVENYDVVINDFECITSLACAYKNIASVNFGHQASFQSARTPRPARKELAGEFILQHYGRAASYMGLHFQRYDDFIYTPVIKKDILQARPVNKGHITVYLSAYSDATVTKYLSKINNSRFQVFSKETSTPYTIGNISFIPVNNQQFTQSMISSAGVITGAGFETPAEAMQLQKKLMVIPIRGQYEQLCNAAALQQMGIKVLDRLDDGFAAAFDEWMQNNCQQVVEYGDIAPQLISRLLEDYPYRGASLDLLYPDFVFN